MCFNEVNQVVLQKEMLFNTCFVTLFETKKKKGEEKREHQRSFIAFSTNVYKAYTCYRDDDGRNRFSKKKVLSKV